eukprot:m.65000 g.65000  ORF g.65000 m.65000 type:complete len:366 (+) comp13961_c0_seq2:365-1462(+)
MSDKPSVLILGGVGFIGRHLVVHLVKNNLASFIRVADKVLPQTAYLTPEQTAAFAKVEFVQANLAREPNVKKAFQLDGGKSFDWVFNCAAMTKYGQGEAVYKEHVLDLSIGCAKEAAATKVKRFIELSTAQVYTSDKKPSSEDDKLSPWTDLATAKAKVEEALAQIPGLNYIIVRPAIVYGVSDMLGLTPRLIVGAVYKKIDETMKVLWTAKLRLNTVHVDDLVKGLVLLAEKGVLKEVYNFADKADSTQESINTIVAALFNIKFDYVGTIVSNLARLSMADTTETVNEKHMQPWAEMCSQAGIANTPLSPFLDQELLYNNSLSVDGTKVESLGFTYSHPEPTVDDLRAVVQSYVDLKLFPPGYL